MQEIQEELEKLKQQLIIVEGKKDKLALEKLGIRNVLQLKGPLYKMVDQVTHNLKNQKKECVVLTDLDEEGKKLYSTLQHQLQQNGIQINNSFRNFLFKNTQLRQIEGLPSYIENHHKFLNS